MRLFLPVLLILVALLAFASCGDDDSLKERIQGEEATPRPLPVVQIFVEGATASARLSVEVAATRAQRELGLMNREKLGEDEGMLFLFPGDSSVGFWMHNTLIPLTIAYIGADGQVQELEDGRPQDDTILTPSRPYRYVLEVNKGWFERHKLGVGARVALPPGLPQAE